MLTTRTDILRHLDGLGIKTVTIDHPATATVAESSRAGKALPGADTKNLLVKDRTRPDGEANYLLIVARTNAVVDLKAVSRKAGTGRLSFARPEALFERLGVRPGAVTVFALVNAPPDRVRLILDAGLLESDSINAHPMENTATTNIARDDLLRFIRATRHEPILMAFDAAP